MLTLEYRTNRHSIQSLTKVQTLDSHASGVNILLVITYNVHIPPCKTNAWLPKLDHHEFTDNKWRHDVMLSLVNSLFVGQIFYCTINAMLISKPGIEEGKQLK